MIKDYVSVDRIYAKLVRDITDQFSEGDVIEWSGEALEFIGAVREYEEAIAFVEVKNHQCEMPNGIHAIIQVARDNQWSNSPSANGICPAKIIAASQVENPTSIPVALDCYGQPINDYDLAYYRPYFDLKAEYGPWSYSSFYRTRFTPVRLSTSTLYDSLVCKINEEGYASYGEDKYTVISRKVMRVSFREGMVAIAYLKQRLDDSGYPLVPDHVSYTTAITKYIDMKMLYKDWRSGKAGAQALYETASADWQWYCKQAGNLSMMIQGEDEAQNFLDQRSYMLPRNNKYYDFFGNLAAPERRTWNDPDRRNNNAILFNGGR